MIATAGTADFDGDPRVIAGVPDIGADELVVAPTVVTGAATSTTTSSVTLAGSVNPNGGATSTAFEYGTAAGYGTSTAADSLPAGTDMRAISAALSGLLPGTTYHYRLVAHNESGTTAGEDRTFTTEAASIVSSPPVAEPLVTTQTATDVVAPVLSRLRLTPARFRAAPRGAALAAAAATGSTLTYRLSEAARVRFTAARAATGVRRSGKCVKAVRGASTKPCTRWVSVRGAFTHDGAAGVNRVRFTGRLGGRSLAPGRYRVAARARDAAGNAGRVVSALFRIVR